MFFVVLGIFRKKSVVSLRKLGIFLVNGFNKISKRLLSLLVRHVGPAIMGRSFKSMISAISTVEVVDFSHAVFIVLLLCTLGRP